MPRRGGADEVTASISGEAQNPTGGGSCPSGEQRAQRLDIFWGAIFSADAPIAIPAPVQSWRTRKRTI
jgi:hypothetical protein